MVDAEYGNQGLDFKMVPREGFGWMNCAVFALPVLLRLRSSLTLAAYQVGLTFLTQHMRRAVAACTSPEVFFGRMNDVSGITLGHSKPLSSTDPFGIAMENLSIN